MPFGPTHPRRCPGTVAAMMTAASCLVHVPAEFLSTTARGHGRRAARRAPGGDSLPAAVAAPVHHARPAGPPPPAHGDGTGFVRLFRIYFCMVPVPFGSARMPASVTCRLLPAGPSTWRWPECTPGKQRQLHNAALREWVDCRRRTGATIGHCGQCGSLTACRRDIPGTAGTRGAVQRGTLPDEAIKGFSARARKGPADFPRGGAGI